MTRTAFLGMALAMSHFLGAAHLRAQNACLHLGCPGGGAYLYVNNICREPESGTSPPETGTFQWNTTLSECNPCVEISYATMTPAENCQGFYHPDAPICDGVETKISWSGGAEGLKLTGGWSGATLCIESFTTAKSGSVTVTATDCQGNQISTIINVEIDDGTCTTDCEDGDAPAIGNATTVNGSAAAYVALGRGAFVS